MSTLTDLAAEYAAACADLAKAEDAVDANSTAVNALQAEWKPLFARACELRERCGEIQQRLLDVAKGGK